MVGLKTFIGSKVSVHQGQPKHSLAPLPISTFKKLRKHSISLEIGNLGRLQLKLQFVCNKRNKFGMRRFAVDYFCGRTAFLKASASLLIFSPLMVTAPRVVFIRMLRFVY